MNAPPNDPTMTELLFRASAQISGSLTVRLRPLGLQVDEMRVLRALKTEGGRSMGGLAEELVISGPTLTKMVDRLFVSCYGGSFDIGDDKVWDTWQIEGPEMVWYFRGVPHIHGYFHLAA